MDHLLSTVNYQEHEWLICRDLKVIGLVLELQGGHTKYLCFLCLWDSQVDNQHYLRQKWPLRQRLKPGLQNIVSPSSWTEQNTASTLMYQLRSNQELCESNRQGRQQVCLLMDKHGETQGLYIWWTLNKELMKDPMFDETLSKAELSLKSLVKNFLGNH